MKTKRNEIKRDWTLSMETKGDLIRAIVDLPCGSGCSMFDWKVKHATLDLLPARQACLAHKAVDSEKYFESTVDDVDVVFAKRERDEAIERLERALMKATKSQLWEFIGFLLEDIEC